MMQCGTWNHGNRRNTNWKWLVTRSWKICFFVNKDDRVIEMRNDSATEKYTNFIPLFSIPYLLFSFDFFWASIFYSFTSVIDIDVGTKKEQGLKKMPLRTDFFHILWKCFWYLCLFLMKNIVKIISNTQLFNWKYS